LKINPSDGVQFRPTVHTLSLTGGGEHGKI